MRKAPVDWISTAEALDGFAQYMAAETDAGRVSECYLDTEADSLHHYSEKLCLMQLAVGARIALIDTLALSDMTALLVQLDRLTVWFHGADYDLTLLQKTYQWSPRTMRDTQIAARLTGHRELGLGALVTKHTGLVLSKASQKADWSLRPLPAKMIEYAADDVRYLPEVSHALLKELEEKKRTKWFVQSCASLTADVAGRGERVKDDPWRVNGSGRLHAKGLAFLKAAWQWRDGIARERDVPPFRVMNNQDLVAQATRFQDEDRLALPERWRPAWKQALLEAADEVRRTSPDTWPQRQKSRGRYVSEDEKKRIETLCKSRDEKAAALGIESSVLGSRAVMEELVLEPNGTMAARMMTWQREVLSEEIAAASVPSPAPQPSGELPLEV